MIHPLRQRHRRILFVLGMVLPLAFVWGIVARKPMPKMAALPSKLSAAPQKFNAQIWERTNLFAKPLIRVRLLRETAATGGYAVEFFALKDFIKPDLMVYWVAGNSVLTGELPSNAQRLGVFSSAALNLPNNVTAQSGALILYSLADNEVVAFSKPFEISQPTTR